MRLVLQSVSVLLLVAQVACVGHQRLAHVQNLSEEGRELFARYRQFMTEGQQDQFLALPGDEERKAFVEALHVEERLSRYPEHVRTAIWNQEVVPGMDRAAVLLSWGTPQQREWDDAESARGNEVERWNYRREANWVQVLIANGVVTAVERTESDR